MELIKLESQTVDGTLVSATFCTDKGMNLVSLKFGPHELMDQTTSILFNQRAAGLGALIGPHFHHRKDKDIIIPKDPFLFPHLELLREKNIKEPFSHGIARYVPWDIKRKEKNGVEAQLSSQTKWQGVSFGELEGMDFEMTFKAFFNGTGLLIDYSIISQKPSVIGFHYYYALHKEGPNIIESQVKDRYVDGGETKKIPESFGYNPGNHNLNFNLINNADYNFKPFSKFNFKSTIGSVKLKRPDYTLKVDYTCPSEESSWQLYHPKGAMFACIEPLSAIDPRKPKRNISGLALHISLV
jgi:hypothetical protein